MAAQSSTWRDQRMVKLLICILIFAVALGVRLPGIGWGLKNELHNQSYHPDEPLIFDFSHHTNLYGAPDEHEYYNYGTLYYAILRTAEAVGVMTGNIKPPPVLVQWPQASPQEWDSVNTYSSESILSGRLASAVAGAGTAVLIFLILVRWTTLLGSLSGAALVAFSPAHVEHSRFQTVDIISLFFVSLATLACLRMLRAELEDSKQWLIEVCISAALCGFAASTRYSDILLILSVWTVLIIRRPTGWVKMVPLAGLIAVAAFVVTTPGSVTDTQYFLANQQYQATHANVGHGLVFVGRPSGFLFHIYELMVGISAAAALLGLAGLLYAALRKHAWAWVILAYFIPYYITIGILQVMFLRYGFPLYLGVSVGFGYAISGIQRRIGGPMLGRVGAALVAVLALVGLESPQSGIRGVALFTKWMQGTDPRDEAGRYLKDLAAKTPAMDVGFFGDSPWFWSIPVVKDADYIEFQGPEVRAQYFAQTRNPTAVSLTTGAHPMYIILSSYEIEDAQRLKDRTDLTAEQISDVETNKLMLSALNDSYAVDRTFGGDGPTLHDLEYIRPAVWVYKRKDVR